METLEHDYRTGNLNFVLQQIVNHRYRLRLNIPETETQKEIYNNCVTVAKKLLIKVGQIDDDELICDMQSYITTLNGRSPHAPVQP